MLSSPGRAWIECTVNNQCWYLQGSNLFHHSWLLYKAITICPKNLIDLEIDMEAIHKKLPSEFPST
ncbi:hypothetical protein KTT_50200 [Tengunoibacter tsumagoiensis]|uniref:Uncharacterized protein n=1 Tax=Tengunoibacter tsumagoiensis TaxID=2014871 RepID=A0A402A861_9CHLR|nr:hypothetical protein KTT_50200 [Tengunoibacter tsumagoiensis]